MGRIALIGVAVILLIMMMNSSFLPLDGLEDKLWLVAILPTVYILGLTLLSD